MTPTSRAITLLALSGTILSLAGCKSSSAESDVNAGLSTLTNPEQDAAAAADAGALAAVKMPNAPASDLRTLVEQSALDLERLLAAQASASEDQTTATLAGAAPIDATAATLDAPAVTLEDAALDSGEAASGLAALADGAALARQDALGAPITPLITENPLAAVAFDSTFTLFDTAASYRRFLIASTLLPGMDPAAGVASASVLSESIALASSPSNEAAATEGASEAAAVSENAPAVETLRVTTAVLCRAVQGFGRYTPFTSDKFAVGFAHRVILYTEIDDFTHQDLTDAPDGSRFAVEVGQELLLYPQGGSTPVWQKPEQTVRELSRNRARDFYLVHEFALPQTLSLGSYVLKVRMRDKATGAVDEAMVPIHIVADPSLALEQR